MVNYGNGFIYKLCSKDTSIKDEYVGSSVDFTERKRCHKTRCNNPNDKKYNLNVYKFIRKNGGFENWSMIQIEKYPCGSRRELETRERHWIETLESKLNSYIPTRKRQEYYVEKKDEILEKKKEYYEKNKDEILEKNKEYYVEHRDELLEKMKERYEEKKDEILEYKKEYYEKNKDEIKKKNKEYYEEKKDEILEYKKEYYEKNKDEILEKRKDRYEEKKDEILEKAKEKITCECGCEITKVYLIKHRKTQKHINLMISKNNPEN